MSENHGTKTKVDCVLIWMNGCTPCSLFIEQDWDNIMKCKTIEIDDNRSIPLNTTKCERMELSKDFEEIIKVTNENGFPSLFVIYKNVDAATGKIIRQAEQFPDEKYKRNLEGVLKFAREFVRKCDYEAATTAQTGGCPCMKQMGGSTHTNIEQLSAKIKSLDAELKRQQEQISALKNK